jgi:hypothetical protein
MANALQRGQLEHKRFCQTQATVNAEALQARG